MPRHDYKCKKCDTTEEKFVPLQDFDETQLCEVCGKDLERLFPMDGATHGDEAAWLRTATEFLKDGEPHTIHKNPISSRKEYKQLLKEKGLEPVG